MILIDALDTPVVSGGGGAAGGENMGRRQGCWGEGQGREWVRRGGRNGWTGAYGKTFIDALDTVVVRG